VVRVHYGIWGLHFLHRLVHEVSPFWPDTRAHRTIYYRIFLDEYRYFVAILRGHAS
jgi:hypothetical protein